MFKAYTDFTKLITPAFVDYYYLETGTTDDLGEWNGFIECFLDTFNGFRNPNLLEAGLKDSLNKVEKELQNELDKLDSKRKKDLFLYDLRQKIEELHSSISKSEARYVHHNVIANQLDKRYFAEMDTYHQNGMEPFLKVCFQFIERLEISLIYLNNPETLPEKEKTAPYNLIRPGFDLKKLEELYNVLIQNNLIEADKVSFNYWFSITKLETRLDYYRANKLVWIDTKASLIYFIRYVIPEENNDGKWYSADSIFSFSKDLNLKISSLISRNDGVPRKKIKVELDRFI